MKGPSLNPVIIALLLCLSLKTAFAFQTRNGNSFLTQRRTFSSSLVQHPKPQHKFPRRTPSELGSSATFQAVEGVKDLFEDEIKQFIKQSALAGTVKRGFLKARPTPQKTKLIVAGLTHAVHIEELMLYFYFGWLFLPTINAVQTFRHRKRASKPNRAKTFLKRYGYILADHTSQLSKLGFCIYVVDIIKIVLEGMGFEFARKFNIANVFGRIAFTLWTSNRVSALKRYLLAKQTKSDPTDLEGQTQIVDRFFDAFIYGIGIYLCLDTLKSKLGAFQKGFVAFGSASTLVVSLASQGIISQILNGLFVASSGQFAKGDIVKFSNNLQGKIVNLGWTNTVLRGSDVSTTRSVACYSATMPPD